MEQKTLNLGKKVIYGFGDLGGNFLAIFIGAFIMIYLTNSIGLNPGMIGTLMKHFKSPSRAGETSRR